MAAAMAVGKVAAKAVAGLEAGATAAAYWVEGMVAETVVARVAGRAVAGSEPRWVDMAEVRVGSDAPVAGAAATAVAARVAAWVVEREVVEGAATVAVAAAAATAVAAPAVVAVDSAAWLEVVVVARPEVMGEMKVAPGSRVDEGVGGLVAAWRAATSVVATEGAAERPHPCSSRCSCSRGC